MRVPQPDIIEHFGNADAVPQLPERCLSRKAGIVRCCLYNFYVRQDELPPYDRPMKGFRPAFFQKGWMVSARVFPRW